VGRIVGREVGRLLVGPGLGTSEGKELGTFEGSELGTSEGNADKDGISELV